MPRKKILTLEIFLISIIFFCETYHHSIGFCVENALFCQQVECQVKQGKKQATRHGSREHSERPKWRIRRSN